MQVCGKKFKVLVLKCLDHGHRVTPKSCPTRCTGIESVRYRTTVPGILARILGMDSRAYSYDNYTVE
eukprot:COSAG02_NODE_3634_length_6446_cov_3.541201_8_plen_67_part_00